MATATGHHAAPAPPALTPFARLPFGVTHKDGPWATGCWLLAWTAAWAWVSGFAATPNGFLFLGALAAVLLSAPFGWRWMSDGVAPPPDPGHASLLFDRGLGLWTLRLLVWRIPCALADVVVTVAWNAAAGRRARRAWEASALIAEDDDGDDRGRGTAGDRGPVPPRGSARRGRRHEPLDEPTGEHRLDDTPPRARTAAGLPGDATTGVGAVRRADYSDDLHDAFPDPQTRREPRRDRLARLLQLKRDERLD